ncbi:MAG: hypothetical protein A2600_05040 [Candidatus Lambdaproteobacteria bacterium RIFOXYD1_FULL_56_27]|nr:MAG: hypothetical protein A2426_07895 [Candidatus Lambdaproteobacteria bacterium RIFOXYC1_FULL_56_13]OGH09918.1 MAG: hypothetical protein A2600_05040 [Candidatus Lambdaproteobacteria bacterium RIFOXYD1_FULL_56_27]
MPRVPNFRQKPKRPSLMALNLRLRKTQQTRLLRLWVLGSFVFSLLGLSVGFTLVPSQSASFVPTGKLAALDPHFFCSTGDLSGAPQKGNSDAAPEHCGHCHFCASPAAWSLNGGPSFAFLAKSPQVLPPAYAASPSERPWFSPSSRGPPAV